MNSEFKGLKVSILHDFDELDECEDKPKDDELIESIFSRIADKTRQKDDISSEDLEE